ncbi:hypothetical protein [Psychromonas ossibalaenae]|uniref:hypothetical protein n=1 Tax=Psychromonas ossibalaenae TaxID=444922 RepID=UPI00036C477E|nr:hypothetical protein [Psychromonas ossibalaenae]
MKKRSYKIFLTALMSIFIFACADDPVVTTVETPVETPADTSTTLQPQAVAADAPTAKSGEQILGNPNYLAISYGAWRSTTREAGADVPSVAQQKEDMKILAAMGIKVLRTYNTQGYIGLDGKSNTENLLIAIDELMTEDSSFEMYVMLGIWIDALNSWTDLEVIHDQENPVNADEMAAGIQLAKDYPEIVKVIAVGNEAMVHWAPYHVAPAIILNHVNTLQALKVSGDINENIWITSSDNHAVWATQGDYASADMDALIAAVDYISLHTYPFHDTHYDSAFWLAPEDETSLSAQEQADAAMIRAKEKALAQYKTAQDHMLSLDIDPKPIHIGETGWASETNVNYGDEGSKAADEYKQKAFYDAMRAWSNEFGAALFFFEAFDEPWKGAADNTGDSEKHFGLIDIDGKAKYVLWNMVDDGVFDGLTRGGNSVTKSFGGVEQDVLDTVLAPNPAPVTGGPVDGESFAVSNTGLSAVAWEDTAWIAEDAGVVTVTTPPSAGTAKDWGWGASLGLAGQAGENLSGFEAGTLKFDIKGTTSSLINIGFQTGLYDNPTRPQTNNYVIFGTGSYPITSEWVTYEIAVTDLVKGAPDFEDVTSLIYFSGAADDGGIIEVRNIYFQK